MKKFFAAAMASAMVVSMASVSLAALLDGEHVIGVFDGQPLKYTTDKNWFVEYTENVPYGNTIFYQLYTYTNATDSTIPALPVKGDAVPGTDTTQVIRPNSPVTKYDAIKGTSIKQKWEMNGTAIEKVEIVKKKYGPSSAEYGYYLSVKSKANTKTGSTDVTGTITLRKTGTDGFIVADKNEIVAELGFTLGYTADDVNTDVTSDPKLFKVKENDDTTFNFTELDGAYYDVATKGQADILLKADVKYNTDIANKYPNANIEFFNGNGATFNKTGELTLPATKGSFLYLNVDGKLTPVKATYDQYEEAFKFKTRTLGSYIISDVELKTTSTTPDPVAPESSEPAIVAPPTTTTKPNPNTGANA